jgi:hypothetical protein
MSASVPWKVATDGHDIFLDVSKLTACVSLVQSTLNSVGSC